MKKYLTLSLLFGLSLSVLKAQNVGINTDGSSPDADALLHLNNHSTSNLDASLLRIENNKNSTSNITGIEFFNNATGATAQWQVYIPASGSTDLRFNNNGTDLITIQNDGDVGIGTTTPTATLDVDGSAIFNESGAAKDFRIESDANTHMLYVNGANNAMGINTSTPASGLHINTSMGLAVSTLTAATTLNQTHNVVLCNTGPYTVTLPAAASNTGKVYYIKNIDADGDDVIVDANGSETIDGQTTYYLSAINHAIRIVSDGTNWQLIEESGKLTAQSTFTPANCDGSTFVWNDVTNPTTGKTWMDRNLGAKQVATASNDADSYGDLYQWGRLKDGHQCRNSDTTTTLSSNDVPGHGDFITTSSTPYDWRNPQNDNLWQGVNGDNNPCPRGYRIPTSTELNNERLSWNTNNAAGAFGSVLKLPMAGFRNRSDGSIRNVGTFGRYWSSTVSGTDADFLAFNSSTTSMNTNPRTYGRSVRCIKD